MDIVTLEQAKAAARREAESPGSGIGALAYSENGTGAATTVSTAAVGPAFGCVAFEPTDCDLWISWELRFSINTAPGATYGGSLDGILWEVTMSGSTVIVTEVDRMPLDVAAGRPIKTEFGKAHGRVHIGPTTTHRVWGVGAGLQKDNVAGLLIGAIRNQPSSKTWISGDAG